MKTIYIDRDDVGNNQSLGICYVNDENGCEIFNSQSIERGWLDNKSRISCIPAGTYDVKLEYSNRFKTDLYEIYGVSNRSECKFHAANFAKQLNGCIALGKNRVDINGDGFKDVTSSKDTMKRFHNAMDGDKYAVLVVRNI